MLPARLFDRFSAVPNPAEQTISSAKAVPQRRLTLLDTTSIIVGIIIGSGFYKSSPLIAMQVPNAIALVGLWLAGGLFALIGSLCYAELATAFPAEGGDYVFLKRAFGHRTGFLFAWAEMWVVKPGAIGAMAFVFADYAHRIHPLGTQSLVIYAAGSVALLTAVNMAGLALGKWTQNVLTIAKVAGLLTVVAIGLTCVSPEARSRVTKAGTVDWNFAMILILYAYGGWNDMAYVGAEVRHPEKNILRALVLGTLAVTAIYALLTVSFVHALGFQGTRDASAVAADVTALGLGDWGAVAVSVLVCVSALGAINGMVFTGSRIYYALGNDYRGLARLGAWSAERGTPAWSLAAQGAIALGVLLGFGWRPSTAADAGGFGRMVEFTLPVFWFFLLLVGVSLFKLRRCASDTPRPFRVPGYPVTPLLFCASSAFMLWASLTYAYRIRSGAAAWSIGWLAVGLLVALWIKPTAPLPRDA